MTDDDFDVRLGQVERAIAVINTIENNPDLQAAAFSHLFGTAPSLRGDIIEDVPNHGDLAAEEKPDARPNEANGGSGAAGRAQRAGAKRTSKATVTQDKSLDPAPPNAQSWKDFVAEKNPATQAEKNTAAVYWLKEVAELEKAGVNQVFTLYIDAGWKPPADPRNSLQVTASKDGTLDTADMADIKLAPRGIGLVKNDLPRADKQ